jgi:hypothetical protein
MEDESRDGPGAGWYRTAQGTARYWDGQAWTDQERPLSSEGPLTSPSDQPAATEPRPATPPQLPGTSPQYERQHRRRGRLRHWLVGAAVIVVIVVAIFAVGTVHGLRPSLAAPDSPTSTTAPGSPAAPTPLGAPAATPGLSEATAGCVSIERELPLLPQVTPALTALRQFETAAAPIESANRADATVWAPLALDVNAVIKDLESGNSPQLQVDSLKAEQDCR